MPMWYNGRGKPRPYREENLKKEHFRANTLFNRRVFVRAS